MARKKPTFVVAPGALPAVAESALPGSGIAFSFVYKRYHQLPFAWITGSQLSYVPPLARIANRTLNLSSDEGSLLQSLLSDNAEERSKLPPRRGHNDEWYHERCVFCCSCKNSINSQYQKRGSRCHGCRRWFHNTCMPAQKDSSSTSNSASSKGQPAAASAGAGSGSHRSNPQEAAATGAAAAPAAQSIDDTSASKEQPRRESRGTLFFHTDECKQVYKRLAAVAAAGDQPLPVPRKRSFLPWQQQQQPQEQHSWRLLDLAEVRHLYKDAQRRGTLVKLHSKIHRQLEEQEQQQQQQHSKASSSSTTETQQQQGEQGAATRPAPPSRLDDFMHVCELLRVMADTPKDLLEDSFALITRKEGGGPTCAATFNIYGSDHARLQGLATPTFLQRQGHATSLVRQLESVLRDTGLQQLTVVVEPEGLNASAERHGVLDAAAVEQWLTRLGYKPVSAEQCMLWRRQLPEYHKNLTAGCSLMVKPLTTSKKGWLW